MAVKIQQSTFRDVNRLFTIAADRRLTNVVLISEREDGHLALLVAPDLGLEKINWMIDEIKWALIEETTK